MTTDSLLGFVLGALLVAQAGQFGIVHGAGLGLALDASSARAERLCGAKDGDAFALERVSAVRADHLAIQPNRQSATRRFNSFGDGNKSRGVGFFAEPFGLFRFLLRVSIRVSLAQAINDRGILAGSPRTQALHLALVCGLCGVDVFHEQRISATACACQAIGKDSRYISACYDK